MPRRIVWPKVKKLWWCYTCNIPVLQDTCPLCKGRARRVRLSDPGDARPAFARDYRFLQQAYEYEFGTLEGLNTVLGRSVAVLNKAPYYDEMKEVVVDGVQVGRLYFDPLLRRWRFRLSRYSATKLFAEYPHILETVSVDKKRFMHGDIIRIDRDIETNKQVILVDPKGSVVGIGYSKGRGRLMVHSWWGVEEADEEIVNTESLKKTDLNDVVKVHREHMHILISKAKKYVAITYEKIRKPVIVSFSGGKDSLVSLHLLLDLGFDPVVLFNNTGIELPETVDTVYKTVEKYGLKLVEASAEDRFWKAVYELGIPGRDYRWCCKVCKLAPLASTVNRLWKDGGLNVVGQRAYESIDRARSPQLWRLRWAPTLINVSLINEWSQFEVWLYIFMNNLEPNPLYFMGYERIGCFMCPASTLAELDLVMQTNRDLWSKWLEVLEFWAKKLELPREWIDYGLWRWNAPARYRTMLAKRLGVADRVDNWRHTFKYMANPRINITKNGKTIEIAFDSDIDLECIEKQVTTVNPQTFEIDKDKGVAKLRWSYAEVVVQNNKIRAYLDSEESIENVVDVLKLLYRWRLCTGCRSCETICPNNAAKIEIAMGRPRPTVDKERCSSCKFCIYNCPVAEVYVEHVVAPLIFDDPEAWRRKTREHHDEVLDKIRSFIKARMLMAKSAIQQQMKGDTPVDVAGFFEVESWGV